MTARAKLRTAQTPTAADVLARLKSRSSRTVRDGFLRFGIPNGTALGVSMPGIQSLAKAIGRDHALAGALWETNVYEARLLVAYVGDPEQLTVAEMDSWCRAFDNWAVCDTLCFALFDRSPHAWGRVLAWSRRRAEFEKRAAFALLWALAVHDRTSPDARFHEGLGLIERASEDERHFVKKAVNMALRAIGKRRPGVHAAAVATAERLAASESLSARWIGRDALKELRSVGARRRAGASELRAKVAR